MRKIFIIGFIVLGKLIVGAADVESIYLVNVATDVDATAATPLTVAGKLTFAPDAQITLF